MRAKLIIIVAIVAGLIVVASVAIASEISGVPVSTFTRDIRALSEDGGLELPFQAGLLTMLTVIVWAGGGAMALLAATVNRTLQVWLLVLGALLLVMAADDAMMLHEGLGPLLGLPEVAFFAVYGLMAGSLALFAVLCMRDGATVAILIGGATLALSILVDLLFQFDYLLDDGLKLIGALAFATIGPLTISSKAHLKPMPTWAHRGEGRR